MLRSWLWTPTDYLFLLSNLSIFSTTHTYLLTTLFHPVLPATQTPMVCLRFYGYLGTCVTSMCHMGNIPNAPLYVLCVDHGPQIPYQYT